MPFTPAHAAAVLPFARTRLPVAALVIGSMAPDLPYYLPLPVDASTTHFPLGLPVVVLLGAVVWACWTYALRAPLAALVTHEVAPPPAPSARGAAWGAAAIAVGALTHMVWDAFTHPLGAGVQLLPVLQMPVVEPHKLYNVLMYASSALGLAAVSWWAARRVEGPLRPRRAPLAAIAACALVGAVVGRLAAGDALNGVYDSVRVVLLGAVPGAGAGVAAWSLYWWVLRVRGREEAGTP
ncbi:DUF4184 family protein [Nocardiopsis sp. CC223A]|uniref:DUF4184 family protein n=1 Tax=Nocardiopsis sp. CC223A TaxID=3044051 RepID=UPI00278C39AD|nr:DUF4184 family protein [Nocardiopsis sp. CC223A]